MPSDLATLTATGRTDVIPGRKLGIFRLATYAEAEQEFARNHLATAAAVAAVLPDAIGDRIIRAATKDVAEGVFRYGARGFDAQAFTTTHGAFLLWASLRIHDPKVTRTQAEKLLTPGGEGAVLRAVRECAGYNFDAEEEDPKKPDEGGSPSTGDSSSPDSGASGE